MPAADRLTLPLGREDLRELWGSLNEFVESVALATNNIYTTGINSSSDVDYDPSAEHVLPLTAAGDNDILLLHYPLSGKVIGDERPPVRKWWPIPKPHIPYYIGAAIIGIMVIVLVRVKRRRGGEGNGA
ncbi:MAG TPA: hypothetical protein PLJ63_04385 [Flavobacteriales bacterium]|jgi:hypothetical protein|nr:hypothetical protein [Flavobacteriales bacterium]